ncbi:MAG: hypothetical protein JKX76_02230 [Colwellia sp.]|nr:hypothetical protein [Colwellia sp.]
MNILELHDCIIKCHFRALDPRSVGSRLPTSTLPWLTDHEGMQRWYKNIISHKFTMVERHHRSPYEGPAVFRLKAPYRAIAFNVLTGRLLNPFDKFNFDYQGWYFEGKHHRPSQDGPAIVSENCTSYYEHGKRHRPTQEGPAMIYHKSGGSQEYWENGVMRRPSQEGPAKIDKNCYSVSWIWKQQGIVHRPTQEGPAIIQHSIDCKCNPSQPLNLECVRLMSWYENGLKQSQDEIEKCNQ